jgi:hypothetical protein
MERHREHDVWAAFGSNFAERRVKIAESAAFLRVCVYYLDNRFVFDAVFYLIDYNIFTFVRPSLEIPEKVCFWGEGVGISLCGGNAGEDGAKLRPFLPSSGAEWMLPHLVSIPIVRLSKVMICKGRRVYCSPRDIERGCTGAAAG